MVRVCIEQDVAPAHNDAMQGFTCLMAACTNEGAEVMELLLKHGGSIHARDGTPVSHLSSRVLHTILSCTEFCACRAVVLQVMLPFLQTIANMMLLCCEVS